MKIHTFEENNRFLWWFGEFTSSTDHHECLALVFNTGFSTCGFFKEDVIFTSFGPIFFQSALSYIGISLATVLGWNRRRETLRTPPLTMTFMRSTGTPVAV